MIVLSDAGGNAALDAIGRILDGGSIELLTGNGGVIATLRLSDPAAMPAVDGELELNKIAEGEAVITGVATAARAVSADGDEVLLCDCGTVDSDATIKLTPAEIVAGTPVRINSFRLAMP